jgi:hypothetical protein
MKSREDLILDFMLAMSPQVAEFVLNNEHVEPIPLCHELALLAAALVNAYQETT